MGKLVECVPNFSEGHNQDTIRRICEAVRSTGARVVSLEADPDYNRSVLTFVGDPDTALEGAYACIEACHKLIDMTVHKGEHPRLGACDVTPFVPVRDVTMEECAALAHKLGARVGSSLDIPVYLYGAGAKPGRDNLATVRKGQYEGLADKLKDMEWQPDFGPAEMRPKFGAAIIGARPFLIAYNVNLGSDNVEAANEIAKRVRESGRKVGGEKVPGTLKAVKGMGMLLKEKNIAQVSMNLVDFNVTNLHTAFEEVKKFATEFAEEVTGSEIVGLVPMEAMVQAGRYYGGQYLSPEAAVSKAAASLNLADLGYFDISEKVLEIVLEKDEAGNPCEKF